MAGERITVDELFALQASTPPAGLRATIEPIEGDGERVTVTPFDAAGGCQCSRSLVVPRDEVESVTTTDEMHACCGKQLTVVEVAFRSATVAAIFEQVSARRPEAARPAGPMVPPVDPRIPHRAANFVGFDRQVLKAFPSTWDYIGCGLQRTACYLSCPYGPDLCRCVCDQTFNQCLDPTYVGGPC